jgi:hypothetical protein
VPFKVESLILLIVLDASVGNHGQFLFFTSLPDEVVVIDEKRTGDEGVKGGAITKNLVFFIIAVNLSDEIVARLFEAKFLGAADRQPIDIAHMLFKQLRRGHAGQITESSMLLMSWILDECFEIDWRFVKILIVFEEITGYPCRPVGTIT